MMNCDDKLGVCSINSDKNSNIKFELDKKDTLYYIGDPMCSWCYGMSDILKNIEKYCKTNDIKFQILVAGLRAGGGDVWNDNFKSFLKNEWSKISELTKKEFSFSILDLDFFNYDTRPACKAVYIVKLLIKDNSTKILEFFSAIQNKFYAKSEDPKELKFYEEICKENEIDFDEFTNLFNDKKIEDDLEKEFLFSRTFSSSMPSLVFIKEEKKTNISIGYSKYEDVVSKLEKIL
ncbi:DsbA family protein [Aliarcobacter thereius]|nr:hypothetical protein [Aliarcobacter thereius]QBF15316.1 DsbA family protein, FrnE-like subfamily [Aliarcobacter thereius LMG 24486]TLS92054.1 DsbA family protein [Aliarcobacter thereius]